MIARENLDVCAEALKLSGVDNRHRRHFPNHEIPKPSLNVTHAPLISRLSKFATFHEACTCVTSEHIYVHR